MSLRSSPSRPEATASPVGGFLATMLHVAAMSLWLGGLTVVVTAATEQPPDAGIAPCTAVLAAGVRRCHRGRIWPRQGVAPDRRARRGPRAPPTAAYSFVKTGLVIAMVALGALSRHFVQEGRLFGTARPAPQPAAPRSAPSALSLTTLPACAAHLAAEIGVGLAALAVTALLVNTRSAIGDTTTRSDRTASGQAIQGDRLAIVEVIPARSGRPAQLHVYIQSPGGTLSRPTLAPSATVWAPRPAAPPETSKNT